MEKKENKKNNLGVNNKNFFSTDAKGKQKTSSNDSRESKRKISPKTASSNNIKFNPENKSVPELNKESNSYEDKDLKVIFNSTENKENKKSIKEATNNLQKFKDRKSIFEIKDSSSQDASKNFKSFSEEKNFFYSENTPTSKDDKRTNNLNEKNKRVENDIKRSEFIKFQRRVSKKESNEIENKTNFGVHFGTNNRSIKQSAFVNMKRDFNDYVVRTAIHNKLDEEGEEDPFIATFNDIERPIENEIIDIYRYVKDEKRKTKIKNKKNKKKNSSFSNFSNSKKVVFNKVSFKKNISTHTKNYIRSKIRRKIFQNANLIRNAFLSQIRASNFIIRTLFVLLKSIIGLIMNLVSWPILVALLVVFFFLIIFSGGSDTELLYELQKAELYMTELEATEESITGFKYSHNPIDLASFLVSYYDGDFEYTYNTESLLREIFKMEVNTGVGFASVVELGYLNDEQFEEYLELRETRLCFPMYPAPFDFDWLSVISSYVGYRLNPTSQIKTIQLHKGLDFAVDEGVPVRAIASGEVIRAEYSESYGNVVVIKHDDGWRSLYAHLYDYSVRVGDIVDDGTIIGAVGSTGDSTGNHLHLEIYDGEDTLMNPIFLLEVDDGEEE